MHICLKYEASAINEKVRKRKKINGCYLKHTGQIDLHMYMYWRHMRTYILKIRNVRGGGGRSTIAVETIAVEAITSSGGGEV